jgi:hypothetical protein
MHKANLQQYFGYNVLFVAILSALGFWKLLQNPYFEKNKNSKTMVSVGVVCILLILATFTLQKNRQDTKQLVATVITEQFNSLPDHAVVITCADSIQFPSYYYQYVLQKRNDVAIVNICLLSAPWYRENLIRSYPNVQKYLKKDTLDYALLCKDMAPRHTLYIYPWFPEFSTAFSGCTIIPFGLVNQIVPNNSKPSLITVKQTNDAIWKKLLNETNIDEVKESDIRTREALYYLSDQKNFLGLFYLTNGKLDWSLQEFQASRNLSNDTANAIANESAIYFKQGKLQQASDLVKLGLERNAGNAQLYKTLGAIDLRLNNPKEAAENFQFYLEFQPKDPDVSKIKSIVDQITRTTQNL